MAVTKKNRGEVTSVSDLVESVGKLGVADRYLFRGQNVDEPLKPKIARQKVVATSEIIGVEKKMLERFKKESTPFLTDTRPQTDWDWLSVAQHQGMSTRLLDWSANALAALWFAVSVDPPNGKPHGVVWALRIEASDLKSPTKGEDIWNLRRTYVFQPFHVDRRIAAQSGWFSVHKYVEGKDKFISLESNIKYKSKLTKSTVPRGSFGPIRRELRLMGITKSMLFPDLGGLAADIDEEFLQSQRDPKSI
jgi:hypothetical protein